MIILLSPAKTLDTDAGKEITETTKPVFHKEAKYLNNLLKKKKHDEIKSLMHISDNLVTLNRSRFKSFDSEYTSENSNPAIHAFKGDVYLGLDIDSMNKNDVKFLNKHVRILSGLYGFLKPLDRMQPYRLEMGTRLENRRGPNLYKYWDGKLTSAIKTEAESLKSSFIVNLASDEYYKSLNPKKLDLPVIKINFKEDRNGVYKFISYNAKKARGMMVNYMVKNRVKTIEEMKGFNYEEYSFNEELSTNDLLIFTR